jgi:hypothetical protein
MGVGIWLFGCEGGVSLGLHKMAVNDLICDMLRRNKIFMLTYLFLCECVFGVAGGKWGRGCPWERGGRLLARGSSKCENNRLQAGVKQSF